jgi:hypothetical protein
VPSEGRREALNYGPDIEPDAKPLRREFLFLILRREGGESWLLSLLLYQFPAAPEPRAQQLPIDLPAFFRPRWIDALRIDQLLGCFCGGSGRNDMSIPTVRVNRAPRAEIENCSVPTDLQRQQRLAQ